MRVRALSILLAAVCGFAIWRSVRVAVADCIAAEGTPDTLQRALRLMPDREEVLARYAIDRDSSGDQSSAVDEALQRAARLNPLDSSVLMTLGLRAEFRGDRTQAENYLVRAVQVDHQFKPGWTLANYYFRTNQAEKGWPIIGRILKLEPLGFDPMPLFELCWNQTNDAAKILSLIPKTGHRPVQYLEFLMRTQRTDAASAAWPMVLEAADSSDPHDSGQLRAFADFLVRSDRPAESVTVWNQLVDRGIVHAGRLDPAEGLSIADPDFQFPSLSSVFGWHLAEIPGVLSDRLPGSLRLEINGDEPESFQILSTSAPVLSGTHYSLQWKTDGTGLSSPHDPGLSFAITQWPGGAATPCPPLLSGNSICEFVTPPAARERMGETQIDLRYTRAPGTVRISGTLKLFAVTLQPESGK